MITQKMCKKSTVFNVFFFPKENMGTFEVKHSWVECKVALIIVKRWLNNWIDYLLFIVKSPTQWFVANQPSIIQQASFYGTFPD